MGRFLTLFVALAVLVFAQSVPLRAQEAEERSALLAFVENKLSAPNRQIRLNGLRGALSSDVSLNSITIADDDGIWLRIEEPRLVWTRSALLLGRLEIDSLTAERIEVVRRPLSDDSGPSPEASSFSIPELPVAVTVSELKVPVVKLDRSVLDYEVELSVDGSFSLKGGALDLDLVVERNGAVGGRLDAKASYDPDSRRLALDIDLSEPEDGVIAGALDLEGRPPVSIVVQGDAPLDDLEVTLSFDVDAKRILSGQLVLDESNEGLTGRLDVGGPLASILPARHRAFFGQESRLASRFSFPAGGGVTVSELSLESGDLTVAAKINTLSDWFPSLIDIDARLTAQSGLRVNLPDEDNSASLAGAAFSVGYDAERSQNWTAALTVDDLQTSTLSMNRLDLRADGTVSNIQDAAARALAFDLTGAITGVEGQDEALAEALGAQIDIAASGGWKSGEALQLNRLAVDADAFALASEGAFSKGIFDGSFTVTASRLAAFSALSNRDLDGNGRFVVIGTVNLLGGGFDVDLEGNAMSLSVGDRRLDPLLDGETTLSGGVARRPDGLVFRQFRLFNSHLEAGIDGLLATDTADLRARAEIVDLADVAQNASGSATVTLRLSGEERPFDLTASVAVPDGVLAGRSAQAVDLGFTGKIDGESINGALSGSGSVGGEPITLTGDLSAAQGSLNLRNFEAKIGATDITGAVSRNASNLWTGNASISSQDIGAAAALALVEASGAVNGTVDLSGSADGTQSVSVDLDARQMRFAEYRAGSAQIRAAIEDLFGTPRIDATINGRDVLAAGVDFRTLESKVTTEGPRTDFSLDAALGQYATTLILTGDALRGDGGAVSATIDTLALRSSITNATLRSPAKIDVANGVTRIANFDLSVGSGGLSVTGAIGDALDLRLIGSALPLAIANAVRADLGAEGTLNADVQISGSSSDPAASFTISAVGLSVRQLSDAGVSPLSLSAAGRLAGQVVSLSSLSARNNQGINVTASGHAPLSGPGLQVSADGSVPLGFGESFLLTRGTKLSGTLGFKINAAGSLAAPRADGLISLTNGTITDPLSNLRLERVGLLAGLRGDQISINRMQASLSGGGTVSATGQIGLAAGFPADLSISLNRARYGDGQTFSTIASGDLRVSGQLARDPLLSGTINLSEAEITVPESFAGNATLLDVKHVDPSPQVQQTLNRVAEATPAPTPTSRPSILRLDLTVNAPNSIFVRGRGLDAELGGQTRLTGPVTNISPVGGFNLIRGRLEILSKRIDLIQGSITLTGDLDPILLFVGQATAADAEAFIRISGRISDINLSFYSNPELPEDEVLSRIVFDRGLTELTPFQIARLASVAAELSGGKDLAIISNLRAATGLDDLDVVEDADGNAAVRAGKYLNDNIYLGVQAGQTTKATINLDITNDLTARGSVGTDGDSTIGIFFERDY